ncbi:MULTISPECIES: hypothetical protein [Bizionia]|uniref:Uncharacterized protein n=1 Tax=Bizionia algoritergicola TaxID=291187 RepID=A0A5D0QS51_9FLAO|nr:MULTISPECIES: hypothetical protein [Bizionia]OBX21129.1 hypothetical protein BAA08_13825 [Bizionia sp. APA-3]TYB71735.1 hypothetical protein ES675_14445 [Bizionia algoritergicola]
MKPPYTNFHDIETELKQLNLERKIAWEELKLLKTEIKDDFRPYNWIEPIVKGASKYGVFVLFRKLFSRR